MSELNTLHKFPAIVSTRTWMKRTKAWRVNLLIADSGILAPVLTRMIEWRAALLIESPNLDPVRLCPVLICDVARKAKGWELVVETLHESQNWCGVQLTQLTGTEVAVTLTKAEEGEGATPDEAPKPEPPPPPKDNGLVPDERHITSATIQSLNTGLYRNPQFWAFLESQMQMAVKDIDDCRAAVRMLLEVESTRFITKTALAGLMDRFGVWQKCGRNPNADEW